MHLERCTHLIMCDIDGGTNCTDFVGNLLFLAVVFRMIAK